MLYKIPVPSHEQQQIISYLENPMYMVKTGDQSVLTIQWLTHKDENSLSDERHGIKLVKVLPIIQRHLVSKYEKVVLFL